MDERIRIVMRALPVEACSRQVLEEIEREVMNWKSDAVLCCPYCFTTLCYDCVRHQEDHSRYLARFVTRCHTQVSVICSTTDGGNGGLEGAQYVGICILRREILG